VHLKSILFVHYNGLYGNYIVKVIDNEDYKSNINESVLAEVIEKIKKKHGKDI